MSIVRDIWLLHEPII